MSAMSLSAGLLGPARAAEERSTFADVQKIFASHCTRCHGGDAPSGGLRLDTYENVMKGGVVVPKIAKTSVLMARLHGGLGLPQMPMGFTALSEREINAVADWINAGALNTTTASVHWAYVAPVRPAVPKTRNAKWARNPIDAFVLSRLEKEGLRPSPEADKTTLLRRVTLDLTGLPPTPEEVDAFLSDKGAKAYEKVVDRLLASPHYGEKMALPWLDAARYADSNGFQQDGDTFQWVWRDWVVRAMNANTPFDQFTVLQLAGDLLPTTTQATSNGRDALVATAFNRNHMLNGEGGAIAEEQRNVGLFDRVDTTSTVWMGLTMACARCHDHKYDPVTQRDYYGLMAYFNNVPESGVPEGGGQYRVGSPWIYAGDDAQMARLFALDAQAGAATAAKRPDAEKLTKELNDLKALIPRVMVMSDRRPRTTYVLNRGNYEEPLERVEPSTPGMFATSAGKNRLGLAQWIVSPDNPLTARVQVNKYWQTFFGQGLVNTPENFGVQGSPPTHPELLDWLATEFVATGWDVKRMHKLIVMSATYRQTSMTNAALEKRDPDNELLARGARFRMPAMVLRDVALAASGLIDPRIGGKPVYPYQPAGIWDGLNITLERDFTYPQSKGRDLYRRSIYTFWRRTAVPGNMFDAATRQVCTVRESRTSTPLHALTMLNDPTWVEAGRVLAERVLKARTDESQRLELAFRLVCARAPDFVERERLRTLLRVSSAHFAENPKDAESYLAVGESPRDASLFGLELAAYATVCLTIFNLDEAMTRE